jgi:NAD dependent epimerase/dehydratase family enzyme
MKIAIAGGTGFIGSALCTRLLEQGHSLIMLTRSQSHPSGSPNQKWVSWNPPSPGAWEKAIDGSDGVINLAGEPIVGKRWTEAQKEKIRSSRTGTTRSLVTSIAKVGERPKWLINGSAVGYYGPRGDEVVTETAESGEDFLARTCREWEEEAKKAEDYGLRVIRLRTGIVLGKNGGALAKMPWIHLEDEVGLIEFLMENPDAHGPINATAPNPVTMKEFCKTLGKVLHRPSWAPVPAFALRTLLGEMANILLTGQRVLPSEAQRLGYTFRYPMLHEALEACMPM